VKRFTLALPLILLLLGQSGCSDPPPPASPDPSIEILEREFEELCSRIRETQQRTEEIVARLTAEIEENNLDVKTAITEVGETTHEGQRLRQKAGELRRRAQGGREEPII